MVAKLKNVTFSLPENLIDSYRQLAQNNQVASMNAAVREAMEAYIAEKRQEQLLHEMEEAAKDPLFMEDLNETMRAFALADQDTWAEKG